MIGRIFRLSPYLCQRWPLVAVIVLLTVASSAATVLQPWPMKILVDYAFAAGPAPDWLAAGLRFFAFADRSVALVCLAGAATLALFGVNSALNAVLSWSWIAVGQGMVYQLAADVFARLQRLSLRYHAQHSVGDNLDRLTNDTWCAYSIASDVFVSPLQRLVTMIGIGVIAWQMDRWLTVLSFSLAPLLAVAVWYFGPLLKRRARQGREAQARLTRFVHQTVTSMPLVQAFAAERRNLDHFDVLVDEAVAASQRGVLIQKSFGLVSGLTNALGQAIVLLAGGLKILAGSATLGSLLVFIAYMRTLQNAWQGLLETYAKLKASEASLDRLFEVLDANDCMQELDHAQPLPAARAGRGAHLVFESVSFAYEPERLVLNEIQLDVLPGETIAFVGPTGAGKSTLVSLVPRFLDPCRGRVLFDGVDVRSTTLDSLRAQISMVLQEPFLLPCSVAENIAYGCRAATREAIVSAAESANAHEFIRALPHGYDTVIGEKGATLSGGQKQRLAIARALVRNTPLVILDEPSAALDQQTERDLLEALEQLSAGRTTLMIAHRLSTVRRADRIVVLDQGRIVEMGAHADLVNRGGLYQRLCSWQQDYVAEHISS